MISYTVVLLSKSFKGWVWFLSRYIGVQQELDYKTGLKGYVQVFVNQYGTV